MWKLYFQLSLEDFTKLKINRPPNPRSVAVIHCAFVKMSNNYSSSIREC